jgi:Ca2+-binding EF-hand superfamily protein
MPHVPTLATATLNAVVALLITTAPALAQGGAAPAASAGSGLFAMLDENGDGTVTRAELDGCKAKAFARIDANGDGAIDREEITAARARLAEAAERMGRAARAGDGNRLMRADTDGDGRITLAEFTARAPIFALLDADGDGALARAEFDRAAAILRP